MKISIPEKCSEIIGIIETSGFEAYAVGGCVRDSLLGITPADWDITTNALPREVAEMFAPRGNFSVIPTGERFGTVTVFCRAEKETYEVTTYRSDGEYSDGRRPDSVAFSDNIADDLCRRDFTVNSMAFNPESGLIDRHNGQRHLREKTLCLVGAPSERLREDGLRIVRAVRFAYKLKFGIEKRTAEAIEAAIKNGYLDRISRERIYAELLQIIEHLHAGNEAQGLLERLLENIIPELTEINLDRIFNAPPDVAVRMTLLLCGVSVSAAGEILGRLKFDNKTKKEILTLLEIADAASLAATNECVKRTLNKTGKQTFARLLDVQSARGKETSGLRKVFDCVIAAGECYSLKDLAIGGGDLAALGLCGKEIGRRLDACLEEVISGGLPNDKVALLEFINTKFS